MEQLTALKQGRLSSGRILTFEAVWQDFPIFSHIRSSGTGGSRGQRASRTRKSGQSQRRSESDWEERFNLRSSFSTEKVVADLEESEDEKDDWVEQDEVEEVQMEDEEFDWRSENSPLGACEAKLSEMVAMMQKAGDRIQFGD